MTENIANEIEIPIKLDDEVETKLNRGRPNITGLVYDKNNLTAYHGDYYRLKRTVDVLCECGQLIQAGCLTKHKKRAIHTRRMKKLDKY